MKHEDGYFTGPGGLEIYHQSWLPDQEARAVFLLVHGMGEHCGRYGNLVDYFVPKGIAVYGLDHPGHGRSGGKREFVRTFDDFLKALRRYHKKVVAQQPGKPVFILGHSMGGTIALEYLAAFQDEFKGVILSSPSLKPAEPPRPVIRTACRFLSYFLPMAGVLKLDPGAISRDRRVVDAYLEDPLTFKGKTPARLILHMLEAMNRIMENAPQLSLPILILQAGMDRLVDPSGAQEFHDRVGSLDKNLHIYDGLFHEVFNEPERERVLKDLETWLEAHLYSTDQ